MPDKTRYDVIIAGGGFVGTTLALALAALAPNGFRVALIDAEPPQKDKADARASALSAASKGLLSVLGIWPELAGDAQPITSIDITDSSLDAPLRPYFLFRRSGAHRYRSLVQAPTDFATPFLLRTWS